MIAIYEESQTCRLVLFRSLTMWVLAAVLALVFFTDKRSVSAISSDQEKVGVAINSINNYLKDNYISRVFLKDFSSTLTDFGFTWHSFKGSRVSIRDLQTIRVYADPTITPTESNESTVYSYEVLLYLQDGWFDFNFQWTLLGFIGTQGQAAAKSEQNTFRVLGEVSVQNTGSCSHHIDSISVNYGSLDLDLKPDSFGNFLFKPFISFLTNSQKREIFLVNEEISEFLQFSEAQVNLQQLVCESFTRVH